MHNFLNLFSLRNADFFRGYIAKSQKSKFFSSAVKWAVAHSVERDLLPTKYLLWINNYFLNSVRNCYNLGLLLLSHKKRIYLVSDGWISCIVYFSLKNQKLSLVIVVCRNFPHISSSVLWERNCFSSLSKQKLYLALSFVMWKIFATVEW